MDPSNVPLMDQVPMNQMQGGEGNQEQEPPDQRNEFSSVLQLGMPIDFADYDIMLLDPHGAIEPQAPDEIWDELHNVENFLEAKWFSECTCPFCEDWKELKDNEDSYNRRIIQLSMDMEAFNKTTKQNASTFYWNLQRSFTLQKERRWKVQRYFDLRYDFEWTEDQFPGRIGKEHDEAFRVEEIEENKENLVGNNEENEENEEADDEESAEDEAESGEEEESDQESAENEAPAQMSPQSTLRALFPAPGTSMAPFLVQNRSNLAQNQQQMSPQSTLCALFPAPGTSMAPFLPLNRQNQGPRSSQNGSAQQNMVPMLQNRSNGSITQHRRTSFDRMVEAMAAHDTFAPNGLHYPPQNNRSGGLDLHYALGTHRHMAPMVYPQGYRAPAPQYAQNPAHNGHFQAPGAQAGQQYNPWWAYYQDNRAPVRQYPPNWPQNGQIQGPYAQNGAPMAQAHQYAQHPAQNGQFRAPGAPQYAQNAAQNHQFMAPAQQMAPNGQILAQNGQFQAPGAPQYAQNGAQNHQFMALPQQMAPNQAYRGPALAQALQNARNLPQNGHFQAPGAQQFAQNAAQNPQLMAPPQQMAPNQAYRAPAMAQAPQNGQIQAPGRQQHAQNPQIIAPGASVNQNLQSISQYLAWLAPLIHPTPPNQANQANQGLLIPRDQLAAQNAPRQMAPAQAPAQAPLQVQIQQNQDIQVPMLPIVPMDPNPPRKPVVHPDYAINFRREYMDYIKSLLPEMGEYTIKYSNAMAGQRSRIFKWIRDVAQDPSTPMDFGIEELNSMDFDDLCNLTAEENHAIESSECTEEEKTLKKQLQKSFRRMGLAFLGVLEIGLKNEHKRTPQRRANRERLDEIKWEATMKCPELEKELRKLRERLVEAQNAQEAAENGQNILEDQQNAPIQVQNAPEPAQNGSNSVEDQQNAPSRAKNDQESAQNGSNSLEKQQIEPTEALNAQESAKNSPKAVLKGPIEAQSHQESSQTDSHNSKTPKSAMNPHQEGQSQAKDQQIKPIRQSSNAAPIPDALNHRKLILPSEETLKKLREGLRGQELAENGSIRLIAVSLTAPKAIPPAKETFKKVREEDQSAQESVQNGSNSLEDKQIEPIQAQNAPKSAGNGPNSPQNQKNEPKLTPIALKPIPLPKEPQQSKEMSLPGPSRPSGPTQIASDLDVQVIREMRRNTRDPQMEHYQPIRQMRSARNQKKK